MAAAVWWCEALRAVMCAAMVAAMVAAAVGHSLLLLLRL